jgi:hypothetical protein
MKHLNSILALAMFSFFLVSCTQDTDIMDESVNLRAQDAIDFTKIINPNTARAAAQFDNTTNGLYKGIFVSNDLSYHGILTVNLGNDRRYNAILEYGDGQRKKIGFLGEQSNNDGSSNIYEFHGKNGGFTIDLSNHTSPIITKAMIDGQTAQGKLLKETSQNPVRAVLGTFEDSNDTSFNGTWDLLSTSTRTVSVSTSPLTAPDFPPTVDVTVNNITGVVVTRSGSSMVFSDDTMEPYTPGTECETLLPTLPSGLQDPFYTGAKTIRVESAIPGSLVFYDIAINEYGAATQSSVFVAGEAPALWSLIYSKRQEEQYFDLDCNITEAGSWSWKGRTGTITLD